MNDLLYEFLFYLICTTTKRKKSIYQRNSAQNEFQSSLFMHRYLKHAV